MDFKKKVFNGLNNLKPLTLIFVYVIVGIMLQLIMGKFITKDLSLSSVETMIINSVIFIGVGFLIKHGFKIAVFVFIVPMIVRSIDYVEFMVHPIPILNWFEEIVKLTNYLFDILIIYVVINDAKRAYVNKHRIN